MHAEDVAEAYRLAVVGDVRGAFNVAADPVLDPAELGRLLGARPVKVPAGALRALALATWKLHLQPTPPGWLDLALGVPVMDTSGPAPSSAGRRATTRARPCSSCSRGCAKGAGGDSPPLHAKAAARSGSASC